MREGGRRFLGASVAAVMLLTSLSASAKKKMVEVDDGEPEQESEEAEVHVESDKPGVVVAQITGEAFAIGSGGGTASAVAWKDICMAPCSFRMKPGFVTLLTHGDGYVAARTQAQLGPGPSYFVARPGSAGLRVGGYLLTVFGLTMAMTGAIFAAMPASKDYANCPTIGECPEEKRSWPMPVLLGGVALTGIGVGMWVSSSSTLERTGGPARVGAVSVPLALSYRAAF